MARARAENKPLFVDFTGYTCTNCRYMEGSVFPRPEVRSRLEKMVLVTAYTDGNDEVHDKQREYQIERFKTAALPFYAIINPHDDTVLAVHPDMTKDVSRYVAFLDEGEAPAVEVTGKEDEMADLGKRIDEEVADLRRLRDELRVQMHLAKAEAKDLWEDMEQRFSDIEGKAKQVARRAEEPLEDIGEAAKLLAEEIRNGYRRIREML